MLGCQHPWDSCPCTTLLLPDTPSQGSHKDTFSPVCTCHSSHCPGALQPGQAGTWDARCNAGSSQQRPAVPSALPGMGQTLQSGSSQLTQHHLQHPQQHRTNRSPTLGWVPEDSAGCRTGGPAAGSPLLPRQPPGLSVLFRASHKHSRDI